MATRKPSVLFINRVYPPERGATGRLLCDLARATAAAGWQVSVLTIGTGKGVESQGDITVHRRRAPSRPRSFLGYKLVWLRLLLAGLYLPRHDVVVTLSDPPLLVIAGGWIAKLKGSRYIHWCQDLYPDLLPVIGVRLPKALNGFLTRWSRRAMKACDRIVVPGRCVARHLSKSLLDPARLSVIPNWADAELILNGERRRKPRDYRLLDSAKGAKTLAELHRDDDPKFRVLYAGNLGKAHPMEDVLAAATQLQVSHPEIQFVFAGDGPTYDALAEERGRRGIENMRFLPCQPPSRLRELMESGDLHLATMAPAAAGLLVPSKVYAAMAAARPILFVGPAGCEAAKLITDYGAGAVVPPGDPGALAAAIISFREDGDRWFAAHEGAAQAAQNFAPSFSIGEWLKRLNDSLARTQPAIKKRPVL